MQQLLQLLCMVMHESLNNNMTVYYGSVGHATAPLVCCRINSILNNVDCSYIELSGWTADFCTTTLVIAMTRHNCVMFSWLLNEI